MKFIGAFFASVAAMVGGWFGMPPAHPPAEMLDPNQVFTQESRAVPAIPRESPAMPSSNASENAFDTPSRADAEVSGTVYSHADLLAMAGATFSDGILPLGDKKYVTNAPKKGSIYLCRVMKEGGSAQADGPWITSSTWNINKKISILGSVSWPTATFSEKISGAQRTLSGNGLPKNHATGIFPVASTDPAYQYDRNPNAIKAQNLSYSVPANPIYSETPYCMGGESGVMLSGVPIFNGFDAEMRDAAAHEVQDSCEGHPQVSGQYHYHSMSSCFTDTSVTTVLGYALDGFPITGPVVAEGKYLTTDDLDVCHGLTSEIIVDGKKKTTYHYVMTMDFPYSVSCFRDKPSTTGPSGGVPQGMQGGMQVQEGAPQMGQIPPQGGQQSGPPPEAKTACSGKIENATCSFSTPNGSMQGICRTVPEGAFACVPR